MRWSGFGTPGYADVQLRRRASQCRARTDLTSRHLVSEHAIYHCLIPCNCSPRLAQQIVVVTGCTGGIGADTARRLLEAGATVIMGCRATVKAEALLAQWRERRPLTGKADVVPLDLTSFASVRTFAHAMVKVREREAASDTESQRKLLILDSIRILLTFPAEISAHRHSD